MEQQINDVLKKYESALAERKPLTQVAFCMREEDTQSLTQNGFKALTVRTAKDITDDFLTEFSIRDSYVAILYNRRKPLKHEAERMAGSLFNSHVNVKVVDLSLQKLKDEVSDWFEKYGKSSDELVQYIGATRWHAKGSDEEKTAYETDLSAAALETNFNRKISFRSIVAGKDLAPYQITKLMNMRCDHTNSTDKCPFCPINAGKGLYTFEVKNKQDMLELINVTSSQAHTVLQKIMKIPKCGLYEVVNETKANVEEVKLIPEIEFTEGDDSEYVVRKSYYIGNNMRTNQTYLMTGTTLPDPKTQQVVHVIDEAEPVKDNIEEFQLTSELKERLKIFQIEDGDIGKKLADIYADLVANVTRIYHREDLMLAYDLVFHSVISFDFLGERIKKGWTELFVLGDSRTGKTKTLQQIIQHYRAGERISAENTSVAGLIAGLQQTQHRWTLMWGKIPLNDRRLLAIDEASSLKHEDFAQLSDVRSSGVCEVTKIQIQKTRARTRLIFISNPHRQRIVEFTYGILAIKEIVGQNEDISRFDFAISVSDVDVKDAEINRRHDEKPVEHKYTSELSNALVMFAWSRRAEQVKFSRDAEDAILAYANEFADTFSKGVPLVQGAEMRIKFAKLSAALAARLFSVDDSGENVLVGKPHVDFVRAYLLRLYAKEGMDYYDYSIQQKKEFTLDNPDILRSFITTKGHVELLLSTARHNIGDFELIFEKEKREAREIASKLVKARAIKKYYTWYVKSPAFIVFLKDLKDSMEVGERESIPEDML